ncbi:MAG: hypothetical protein GKS04_00195 [Candidatus Mycalebacterium zealandia]|nr:MAG: hypothetical protein GKS04_00195 [Candidatus Mycalebacterium zealandia]
MNKLSTIKNALAVSCSKYEYDCEALLAYFCTDARHALKAFPHNLIDTVITSPPYGNLKNYGTSGEIGFKQKLNGEYFPQLKEIFCDLYRITKKGGAFWLILDTFRFEGKTVALPFELMDMAKKANWVFQDTVIWDKGRNLPWSHKGRFRDVCEHILLFSKGNNLKHFDVDALRNTNGLSPYWVKYPERFHPEGKAPSDIWHIPIPTQGSWSLKGKPEHFCPFPPELVARMTVLTTPKKGLVLDPFCGTGTTMVAAQSLGRIGVGIDINKRYFKNYVKQGKTILREESSRFAKESSTSNEFRKVITHLRTNKFPALLFRELKIDDTAGELVNLIDGFVIDAVKTFNQRNTHILVEFELKVLVSNKRLIKKLTKRVDEAVSRAPLSFFGVKAKVECLHTSSYKDRNQHSKKLLYVYKNGVFNSLVQSIQSEDIYTTVVASCQKKAVGRCPVLLSPLKLDITP